MYLTWRVIAGEVKYWCFLTSSLFADPDFAELRWLADVFASAENRALCLIYAMNRQVRSLF